MAQYYFLDSSAILKRYLAEQGSRYIGELLSEPDAVFYLVSRLLDASLRPSRRHQISPAKDIGHKLSFLCKCQIE